MIDYKTISKKYYFSLFLCLFIAFLARALIATFLPGPWRVDETFQYMEPAHRLLDGHGVITWEWRVGIRSWFIPGFIAGLMKLGVVLGATDLIFFVRMCFSVLSLSVVTAFFWYGWRKGGRFLAWTLGLTAALWPDIASGSIRTLGEFIAGNVLILAIICIISYQEENNLRRATFLASFAGLFLGINAAVRFQIAPASAFAFLFLIKKNRVPQIALAALFGILPIGALGIFDAMTLGTVFQSIVKNYHYNQTLGVATAFGTQPFYYYILKYAKLWGGLSVLVLIFATKAKNEKAVLLPISLFIVFYHSLIPHKEVSFIYPAIPPLVFCAALGFYQTLKNYSLCKAKVLFAMSLSIICAFLGTYAPILTVRSKGIIFEKWVSQQQDVCGIASLLDNKGSFFSNLGGGYSILQKNVPIYLFDNIMDAHLNQEKFNYIITNERDYNLQRPENWAQVKCDDNFICIYHRSGKCSGQPDFNQFSQKISG
ncbi:MAG: hypothetical protein ABF636_01600 [Acetobacter sp.]